MKKILSIFALVLCAITLPLGLVGCKKAKQNGPEYIIGKTYTFESVETTGLDKDEIEGVKTELSSIKFSFTENKFELSSAIEGQDKSEICFFKMNDDRTLSCYSDEEMTKPIYDGVSFYFSKDYKKFYFKVVVEEEGRIGCGIYAC